MLTPQQQQFLKNYLDPKSETWNNIKQSGIKAGYSEEYAENILSDSNGVKWIEEAFEDDKIVKKALNNLSQFLTGENENIKWDASKFALTKLSKKFKDSKEVEIKGTISLSQLLNEAKQE